MTALLLLENRKIMVQTRKLRNRVCMGFGKFSNVMEIDDTIFQDLESFGKERIFKMAIEKFLIFVWKNSKNILKWM